MDIPIILSIGNEKIQDDLLVAQKWHSETGKMTWDIPGYAQAIVPLTWNTRCGHSQTDRIATGCILYHLKGYVINSRIVLERELLIYNRVTGPYYAQYGN